jgi:hypothetical protein
MNSRSDIIKNRMGDIHNLDACVIHWICPQLRYCIRELHMNDKTIAIPGIMPISNM